MNVKRVGNKCEQDFIKLLKEHGYWCHLFESNSVGQPCDIVAIKRDRAILFDVKHCNKERFDFSNIQPNQESCFGYYEYLGNNDCGFAIYHESSHSFVFLEFGLLKHLKSKKEKSIYLKNLPLVKDILL